jgi:hypothetical protein
METTWISEAKKIMGYFEWKNEPRLVMIGGNVTPRKRLQLLKVSRSW